MTPADRQESEQSIAPTLAELEAAISEVYPDETVRHLETHISHVFLAGSVAYKVKKPVDLGFCDFTQLSQRRHFCHEELRLNRRLAAEIYQDVVPFRARADGTYELLEAADEVNSEPSEGKCEYAVRMRRFSQDQLLSKLAADKELLPSWFDQLAHDLTQFHADAPGAPESSRAGTHAQVWKPIVECLSTLRQVAQMPETQRTVVDLEVWCQAEHERLQAWFAMRKQMGQIRECHGDLHLGNMVLQQDRIVVFDCIEFNESLRWIDTISDLAFAVMDLQDRGMPNLAYRLLSEYLQASDDYGSLPGLPFYEVYRSLVRAKVAALRYIQTADNTAERSTAADEFHNYLQLAKKLTQAGKPWFAIMHGLSGSGKSTAALRIVEELGAIRIRSDVVRRRQFPDAATRYLPEANAGTYQRLQEITAVITETNFPAVIDATFIRQAERQAFYDLAAKLQVPYVVIDCAAEPDELRRRIAGRMAASDDPSEADLQVLEKQLRAQQLFTPSELQHVVTVDTASPGAWDQMVGTIRIRLGLE